MSDWYRLDEHKNPVRLPHPPGREFWESNERVVARTKVYDGCEVSTVFLGLDHGYGSDVPIVFETLVFGGPFDGDGDRYATWTEAVVGHARYVEKCQPILTE